MGNEANTTFFRSIAEATLIVGALLIVDQVLGDGDQFQTLSPHPFWVAVLLLTVQYGTVAGLCTALLSSVALFAHGFPPYFANDDFYSYWWRVALVPFEWLIAATVLGELVMRHRRALNQAQQDLQQARSREGVIVEAFKDLELLKEKRERELASLTNSPAQVFEVLSHVDATDRDSILRGAFEAVAVLLRPSKYSLYLREGAILNLSTSQGWLRHDQFESCFSTSSAIYQAVVVHKRTLSVLNVDNAEILAQQGVIAVPIFDQQSPLAIGMLKIESPSWQHMTVLHCAILEQIARWVGALLVANARLRRINVGTDLRRNEIQEVTKLVTNEEDQSGGENQLSSEYLEKRA